MDIIKGPRIVDLRIPRIISVKQDKKEEQKNELTWPKENKDAPLAPFGKRQLYYLNKHGKQVTLTETHAWMMHDRMAEFHGDQNGNMTPPRDPGDYTRFGNLKGGEQWVHKSQIKKQ